MFRAWITVISSTLYKVIQTDFVETAAHNVVPKFDFYRIDGIRLIATPDT